MEKELEHVGLVLKKLDTENEMMLAQIYLSKKLEAVNIIPVCIVTLHTPSKLHSGLHKPSAKN